MPKFERLAWSSIDWAKLDSYPDRTVYQTRAWLDFVAHTQQAEPVVAVLREGANELGFFSGLIGRKYGLPILGSPFKGWNTGYMGFNLKDGVPRGVAVRALLAFAFQDLRCVHLELWDRRLRFEDVDGLGFRQDSALREPNFEVDLTQSEDELFAKMSRACRYSIRRANKSGVLIEEASDLAFADEHYAQLQDVFAKQSLVPNYDAQRVRALIQHIHPTDALLLLRARNAEGKCIASGIFTGFNDTAEFWGGASWREHQKIRPNEAIQWYAMRYWKERGISRYDLGGPAEYKRKYGGEEIYIPWLWRSKYPGLGQMRVLAQQGLWAQRSLQGNLKKIHSRLLES
jgi:hypothetical protein